MPGILALEASSRIVHLSALLAKECQPQKSCPESVVPQCRVVKRRPCSPTDPPVRPCSEEDCSHPRYPCCVNTRIAEKDRVSGALPAKRPTFRTRPANRWTPCAIIFRATDVWGPRKCWLANCLVRSSWISTRPWRAGVVSCDQRPKIPARR